MSTTDFIKKLNKKLGAELVIHADALTTQRRFTSGSVAWDAALGGGYPANQWIEVVGPSSAGKTFTTFKCVAANQREDPEFMTLWVAGEHFDRDQAEALGVDLSRVVLVNTRVAEQAFEAMLDGMECKEFDLIVLDSYPALTTEQEAEKGMDEATMAVGAKLMNKFVRKAGAVGNRALDGSERPYFGIIINQWRDNIGAFSPYGTPKISPGGKGKDYFFYVRIELTKDGQFITEKRPGFKDPVKVGQTTKMKTLKNKSASPQQTASVDLYFDDAPSLGFKRGDYDIVKEFTDIGISLGVITRGGAYYRYNGQQWMGKDGLTEAIKSDSLLQDSLRRDILAASQDNHVLDTMEEE